MPASAFGIPMQGGDSAMLNGPPPSPAQPPLPPMPGDPSMMGGPALGPAGPGGPMPGTPSGLIPPEILTGITQRLAQIDQDLDTFAQVTPDQAAILLQVKEMLKAYMGALLVAGSQPASPTAPGAAFPGGGLDRGGMAM
jgi:hypothetical protein